MLRKVIGRFFRNRWARFDLYELDILKNSIRDSGKSDQLWHRALFLEIKEELNQRREKGNGKSSKQEIKA